MQGLGLFHAPRSHKSADRLGQTTSHPIDGCRPRYRSGGNFDQNSESPGLPYYPIRVLRVWPWVLFLPLRIARASPRSRRGCHTSGCIIELRWILNSYLPSPYGATSRILPGTSYGAASCEISDIVWLCGRRRILEIVSHINELRRHV